MRKGMLGTIGVTVACSLFAGGCGWTGGGTGPGASGAGSPHVVTGGALEVLMAPSTPAATSLYRQLVEAALPQVVRPGEAVALGWATDGDHDDPQPQVVLATIPSVPLPAPPSGGGVASGGNSLQKQVAGFDQHKAALAYGKRLTAWAVSDQQLARTTGAHLAGMLASAAGPETLAGSERDYLQGLFRTAQVFQAAPPGPRTLIVLADLAGVSPPPSGPVVVSLGGAAVILAGTATTSPASYQRAIALWTSWLKAHGAGSVTAVPRHLLTASGLAAAG